MNKQIKVGDTFRVFEVVNTTRQDRTIIGKTTIELAEYMYFKKIKYRTVLINNESRFWKYELKQVGTIRVTSLKDAQ